MSNPTKARSKLKHAGLAGLIFLFVGGQSVTASPLQIRPAADLPQAGTSLEILTWNLGYGGLGKESEFVADGGKRYLPPSRAAVAKNIDTIGRFLDKETADVVLLQEVARASPVNLWHDLFGRVDKALSGRARAFYADLHTGFFPPPFRFVHGLAVYIRLHVSESSVAPLPLEKGNLLPGVKRRYGLLVMHLPIAGCAAGWSLIDVHLAAFDENASTRHEQLAAALRFAEAEFARGQHVVMGGDWNLILAETHFPTTTEDKYLFWVHPFPRDTLPEGWRIAADAATPSVRTNERPYRRDENYRAVIDGFVVSPGLKVDSVKGVDVGFEGSDHQPVRLRVTAPDACPAER